MIEEYCYKTKQSKKKKRKKTSLQEVPSTVMSIVANLADILEGWTQKIAMKKGPVLYLHERSVGVWEYSTSHL